MPKSDLHPALAWTIGILVTVIVLMLVGAGCVWAFGAFDRHIAPRFFPFVDMVLAWAADRQIPTWLGAFALCSIASTLAGISYRLVCIDDSLRPPRK